jgi:hypothetical protein
MVIIHNDMEVLMKKILYPIICFLSFIIIQLVLYDESLGTFLFLIFFLWILLIIPGLSFIYSKIILRDFRKRLIYTFYLSLMVSLSYLFVQTVIIDILRDWGIFATLDKSRLFHALKFFAWSEIWGLLGLIGKRDKSKDEIPQEQ